MQHKPLRVSHLYQAGACWPRLIHRFIPGNWGKLGHVIGLVLVARPGTGGPCFQSKAAAALRLQINTAIEEAALARFHQANASEKVQTQTAATVAGAIVVGGHLAISTIFNSGTDDKFSIGDKVGAASVTATTYAAQSADITAPGAVAIVPTGKKYAEPPRVPEHDSACHPQHRHPRQQSPLREASARLCV